MRIEDYEPYPDDGFGWGDYPKFPAVHEDYKDPHGDWDFPDQRRNYGETVRWCPISFFHWAKGV